MLDAKHNRLLYDALLKAPQGYVFDHAITTTYSLDLESILLIPVALFFSQDMDFDAHQTRADLLEALTKANQHISIFCQKGKIKVPHPYNRLIAFWEKDIYQVQMDSYSKSFHPKIWLIRFIKEDGKGQALYKFICTSRNLTNSRDWDLAISTEGFVDNSISNQNEPIVDMLKWLDGQSKGSIPKNFFKEISKVQFQIPSGFNQLNFHPIGISDKYKNPITHQETVFDERLVMSPFIQEATINSIKEKAKKLYLMSSNVDLSQITPSLLGEIGDIYQFSPFIEDAEKMESISEADEIPMNQNLHAKFYINKKGSNISWFIGSANATSPASKGNIEFLVEAQTNKRNLSPSQIAIQLTNPIDNGIALFESYQGEYCKEVKSIEIREQEIRKLIHEISGLAILGEAIQNENKYYDLLIHLPKSKIVLPEKIEVKLKPLPEKHKKTVPIYLNEKMTINDFKDYEEVDLSPYIIFEILDNGQLVSRFVLDMKIELCNSRLDKIFTSIINNRNRFLNYLFFLMTEETPDNHEDDSEKGKNTDRFEKEIAYFADAPIYEQLLLTASRNPSKLGSIGKFIDRMKLQKDDTGKSIITDDFLEMWQVFNSYSTKK